MDNIILIGMPGCGKSTIGVILAKKLMYSFLDSDLVIQQRAGKRLYRILEEDGPEAFAELENAVNASLDVRRTVVATGGFASLIDTGTDQIDVVDKMLTLEGLEMIYEKNRKPRGKKAAAAEA